MPKKQYECIAEIERLRSDFARLQETALDLDKEAARAQKAETELEKQAEWLAKMQNYDIDDESPSRCPPKHMPPHDCFGGSCQNCWLNAARKAVSAKGECL